MKERTDSVKQPRRKRYTEEFRRSVVDHLQHSGKTTAQVAQEFGVNLWNLRDWKRQYGTVARPTDGVVPSSPEALLEENQHLRKELARVTMQRDILKKTMGILAEASERVTP
ncbi:MAG TPA: transposase [Candidatus Sulfotelmatobacter sp.]|nr:transposase [Candidatus Sulfotelmatobacter sp.]